MLPFTLNEAFLFESEANEYFSRLRDETPWLQEQPSWAYKPMPRLTAWYGDEGTVYTYSGIINEPLPWTDDLLKLKKLAEKESNAPYNSVLLNYYREAPLV